MSLSFIISEWKIPTYTSYGEIGQRQNQNLKVKENVLMHCLQFSVMDVEFE